MIVAPAAPVALSASAGYLLMMRSVLLLECVLAGSFLLSSMLFSKACSRDHQKQEMRSDELAASFVDGGALVEAIHAAETLVERDETRRRLRVGIGRHPATELRVNAIRDQGDTLAAARRAVSSKENLREKGTISL